MSVLSFTPPQAFFLVDRRCPCFGGSLLPAAALHTAIGFLRASEERRLFRAVRHASLHQFNLSRTQSSAGKRRTENATHKYLPQRTGHESAHTKAVREIASGILALKVMIGPLPLADWREFYLLSCRTRAKISDGGSHLEHH